MAVLGYLWFLYLFKKITRNYKLILLFVFALPMTLHQISSLSYDVLHIMFGLTFFVLVVSFPQRRESNRNIPFKNGIIDWIPSYEGMTKYFKLFLILFLFLLSKKIGYEAFVLFLFLIPFEIKPMVILSLIFAPLYFLSKITGSYDINSVLTNKVFDAQYQIGFLLSDPSNIVKVLTVTTLQRLGFYLQSLIGIFGWLEYGLDTLSYLLYGLFFVFIILNINLAGKQILSKNKNILIFISLIISYIFILLLGFVFYTVKGNLIPGGIQGRYFIPFVPFIIIFILQIKYYLGLNNFHKKISFKVSPILTVLTVIYLISATFFSVFNRYY